MMAACVGLALSVSGAPAAARSAAAAPAATARAHFAGTAARDGTSGAVQDRVHTSFAAAYGATPSGEARRDAAPARIDADDAWRAYDEGDFAAAQRIAQAHLRTLDRTPAVREGHDRAAASLWAVRALAARRQGRVRTARAAWDTLVSRYAHALPEPARVPPKDAALRDAALAALDAEPAATLDVTAVPAGATLWLDHRPIGAAPLRTEAAPGEHVLHAKAGRFTLRRTIELLPGETLQQTLELAPAAQLDERALVRGIASRSADLGPLLANVGADVAVAAIEPRADGYALLLGRWQDGTLTHAQGALVPSDLRGLDRVTQALVVALEDAPLTVADVARPIPAATVRSALLGAAETDTDEAGPGWLVPAAVTTAAVLAAAGATFAVVQYVIVPGNEGELDIVVNPEGL